MGCQSTPTRGPGGGGGKGQETQAQAARPLKD
jgi:hypothetical protein